MHRSGAVLNLNPRTGSSDALYTLHVRRALHFESAVYTVKSVTVKRHTYTAPCTCYEHCQCTDINTVHVQSTHWVHSKGHCASSVYTVSALTGVGWTCSFNCMITHRGTVHAQYTRHVHSTVQGLRVLYVRSAPGQCARRVYSFTALRMYTVIARVSALMVYYIIAHIYVLCLQFIHGKGVHWRRRCMSWVIHMCITCFCNEKQLISVQCAPGLHSLTQRRCTVCFNRCALCKRTPRWPKCVSRVESWRDMQKLHIVHYIKHQYRYHFYLSLVHIKCSTIMTF